MPKQQTLTIVVSDDMMDPADLVEKLFDHVEIDRFDPELDDTSEMDDHGSAYMIIEEN